MNFRFGKNKDLDLLSTWNHQLIQDEGHRKPMTLSQLRERMKNWISSDYTAVIFEDKEPVAYALFIENETEIYLRQLFVCRSKRRMGIGRQAVHILRHDIWPKNKRLTVGVLTSNVGAVSFWRSVGFTDYSITLEIVPPNAGT